MAKSVGKRSPLNRFKSHCRDISEQVDGKYSQDEVAELMKFAAITNGYPCKKTKPFQIGKNQVPSRVIPKSMADASDREIYIAQETLQAFADENNFWLTEYDDIERPYRAYAGLRRDESKAFERGLR